MSESQFADFARLRRNAEPGQIRFDDLEMPELMVVDRVAYEWSRNVKPRTHACSALAAPGNSPELHLEALKLNDGGQARHLDRQAGKLPPTPTVLPRGPCTAGTSSSPPHGCH